MFEVIQNVFLCIAMLGAIVVIATGAVMCAVECISIIKDAVEEWRGSNE